MSIPFPYQQGLPFEVRLAQVVGISTSFILTGMSVGTSYYAIPAIKKSPAPLLAQQWQQMYDYGKVIMPPLGIIPTAIYGYLAWSNRNQSGPTLPLYATAAVLSPAFTTYTLLVMGGVNGALIRKAKAASTAKVGDAVVDAVAEAKGQDDTHALAEQWRLHNLVRAGMVGLAGVLALWASLEPMEL